MEKISIIIPAHNAENTIKNSAVSVLNQTYANFEVICINNGSTDSTLNTLNELKEKDGRIIVIDQDVFDSSLAKNTGLDIAAGKYITFLEPGAAYHPQYLEIMLRVINNNNADLVICGYLNFESNSYLLSKWNKYRLDKIKIKDILDRPFFDVFALDKKVEAFEWLKFAKKTLYKKVRFSPELHSLNDKLFWMESLYNSKKCVVIKERLIAYKINAADSSSTQPLSMKMFEEYRDSIIEYNNFLKSNKFGFFEEYEVKAFIANNVYYIFYKLIKNSKIFVDYRKEISKTLIELWEDGMCHFLHLNIFKFFKIHNDFKKLLGNLE